MRPGGLASNRPLLIGAGVGCGFLSILGVLIVVMLIIPALKPPTGQPTSQPISQEPRGDPTLEIDTYRVDRDGNPTQPADVFHSGERVFVRVTLVSVPTTLDVGYIFVQEAGDRGLVDLGQPQIRRVDPSQQGKSVPFWIDRLGEGDYRFVAFLAGPGEKFRRTLGYVSFKMFR